MKDVQIKIGIFYILVVSAKHPHGFTQKDGSDTDLKWL
jgi:hypothetical protein